MRFILSLIVAGVCALALPTPQALAQVVQSLPDTNPDWAEGYVQKIDKNGKVTIKHFGMRNFLYPPGVTEIMVADKSMLDSLRPNQAIVYKTGRNADGRPTMLEFAPQS